MKSKIIELSKSGRIEEALEQLDSFNQSTNNKYTDAIFKINKEWKQYQTSVYIKIYNQQQIEDLILESILEFLQKVPDSDFIYEKIPVVFSNQKEEDEFKYYDTFQKSLESKSQSSNGNDYLYVNSNTLFSNPFSFNGRIRRLEYGLSYIIYLISNFIIQYLGKSMPLILVLLIPVIWFIISQNTKRCHDLNNSGWFQFIPFYALWLLFANGTKGNNLYGTDPKNIFF